MFAFRHSIISRLCKYSHSVLQQTLLFLELRLHCSEHAAQLFFHTSLPTTHLTIAVFSESRRGAATLTSFSFIISTPFPVPVLLFHPTSCRPMCRSPLGARAFPPLLLAVLFFFIPCCFLLVLQSSSAPITLVVVSRDMV